MPGGVRITHDYDELGRLRQMSGTGAEVATADRVFEYDDAGRMTAFSVPGGTNTLTYDDRGLLLSISGPNDSSSFTYTKDGRMATRSDAAGTTTYTYDNAGRLRTVGNPTAGLNLTIDYNSMSLPRLITYGTNGNRRTLTYDSLHRLDTDKLTNAAGTVTLGMIDYGYDQNGNLTSKTTTGFAGASTNTYTYDLANRLTSWTRGSTTTTYAYDASGNRIQAGAKAFTYDARNQLLTQSGGISYVYSPRGTLRQTVVGSVDYTTEVDAFGQVLSQEAAGGTTTYAYDALGRAVRPGFEYTGLGNDLARDASATYVRGPDGELLGVGPGSGAGSRYAWTDLHTDVVGEFTATGTTLSASASYDPLGRVLASTGMQGNLGFQSEWTDDVTDRVNMLSRWYNLDTGQFDTRDSMDVSPVPDSIRANRFQYGDGNPLTTVDPTGHFGIKSFLSKVVKAPVSAAKKTVSAVKNTASTVRSAASSAFKYVSSGRAWNDVKAKTKSTVSKAKKALTVVKDTTVRWAKKKVNKVKDAYQSAKKCVSGGASKCVKETAKKATKKVVESAKATVEAIKQDPWKFVATAAVAVAAAAAVGAMCATGVGCLIVAGAVAGAMSAGAGYVMDAARGDTTFSWSGLASTMLEGGLDGGLSAGLNRFTAGVSRAAGGVSRVAGDAAGSRLAGMSRFIDDGPSSIGALATPRGGALRSSGSAAASIGGGRRSAPAADTRGAAPAGCAPGQSRHSFDPSTRVLLADGRTKPIEDVQPGDVVASADPVTGETTGRRVTQLHVNVDRELTDVSVRDDRTGVVSVVKTTAHHPFWDATDGRWVDAVELVPGHRLWVHDDERLEGDSSGAGGGGGGPPEASVTVVEVVNHTGVEVMRDLTVADLHTYYVLAGDTPLLVHNCGTGAKDGFGLSDDELLSKAIELRDEYANSLRKLSQSKRPATVTAGYNRETRQYAAGASRKGVCAETCVVNQLGGDPSKIVFTSAVRPRTGAQVSICPTCEASFGRAAFPQPGTTFDTDVLRLFD